VWGSQGPLGKRLTAKRLGGMLARSYGIHSDQPERGGHRGYHREAFRKPMTRMGLLPSPTSDASDASDESDADASDTSDTSDASDTGEGQVNDATHQLIEQCHVCGNQLIAPHSRQRGICESCWMHATDPNQESEESA
ncbi:MAG: hypothetical protein ACJ72M_20355, partial [Propionibacteriaceae bacterium]